MIALDHPFVASFPLVLVLRPVRCNDTYYCGRYVHAIKIVDPGNGLKTRALWFEISSLLLFGDQRVVHRVEIGGETVITDSGHAIWYFIGRLWLVVKNSKCNKACSAVTEGDKPQRVLKNEVFVPVIPYLEEGCGCAERRSS